jgi:drug/metabolite transporter (DMT)-like permease
MWAFISTIALSLEATINKTLVRKNNVNYYLANKFWVGLLPMIAFYFLNEGFITKEGIFWLVGVCLLFALQQFIAFHGLARISASTNIVIKQMRLFFLIIISIIIGSSINAFDYVGVVLCFAGGLLITLSETKESTNKKDSLWGIAIALVNALAAIGTSFLLGHALENNLFSSFDYSLFSIVALILVFNVLNFAKKDASMRKFNKKQFTWLELSGLLAVTVNLTRAIALESIGVFYTEIIMSLAPIFIYLFAILNKAERLTLRRSFGVVITVGGVLLTFL